jgi:hypothetical protein
LFAGLALAALLSATIGYAIRAHGTAASSGAGEAFGHVHGLAVDHATGAVYAATHVGLFQVRDEHTAVRVSERAPDLMGFTAVGPGHFLASGHPDGAGDEPANLGLIESTDGGVSWHPISLSGAADFHGLSAAHGAVYGYNSTDGAFMVSTDRRTWQRRSTVAIGAFAVSPDDPEVILAAGRDGLTRSTDGARSWRSAPGTPLVRALAWDVPDEVWGVAPDGTLWRSADGGDTWRSSGRAPGEPHAIATHGSTVLVALAGDEIVASDDGGATWSRRYAPA